MVLKRAGVAGSNITNIILYYKCSVRSFILAYAVPALVALVGYEIIANSSLRAWLPTTVSLHTRTRGIIVKSPVYPCISSTIEYPVYSAIFRLPM